MMKRARVFAVVVILLLATVAAAAPATLKLKVGYYAKTLAGTWRRW